VNIFQSFLGLIEDRQHEVHRLSRHESHFREFQSHPDWSFLTATAAEVLFCDHFHRGTEVGIVIQVEGAENSDMLLHFREPLQGGREGIGYPAAEAITVPCPV